MHDCILGTVFLIWTKVEVDVILRSYSLLVLCLQKIPGDWRGGYLGKSVFWWKLWTYPGCKSEETASRKLGKTHNMCRVIIIYIHIYTYIYIQMYTNVWNRSIYVYVDVYKLQACAIPYFMGLFSEEMYFSKIFTRITLQTPLQSMFVYLVPESSGTCLSPTSRVTSGVADKLVDVVSITGTWGTSGLEIWVSWRIYDPGN